MRIVVADEESRPILGRLWDIKSSEKARQGPLSPRSRRAGLKPIPRSPSASGSLSEGERPQGSGASSS